MPLARPARTTTPPPPPITIARADVAGMTPSDAHQAILGAIDAGIIAATNAAGMLDEHVIDAKVAELADTRNTLVSHAPYTVPSGTWCFAEGPDGPPGPCPTYRDAAAVIADGLGR